MRTSTALRMTAATVALALAAPVAAQQATDQMDPATLSAEAIAAGGAPIYVSAAEIWLLQRELNAQGYDAGSVDGIVGENTIAAVCSFQLAEGLDPTGNINGETLAALGLDGPLRGQAVTDENATQGSTFDAAAAEAASDGGGAPLYISPTSLHRFEMALNAAGYNPGAVDGRWDEDLRAALTSYQQVQGLPATGTLTLATLERLNEEAGQDQGAGATDQAQMTFTADDCAASGQASLAAAATPGAGALGAPIFLGPEVVRDMQIALNARGLAAGPVDGIAGDDFATAVRSLQQTSGLAATGTLDTHVIAFIGQEDDSFGGILDSIQLAVSDGAAGAEVENVQPTGAPGEGTTGTDTGQTTAPADTQPGTDTGQTTTAPADTQPGTDTGQTTAPETGTQPGTGVETETETDVETDVETDTSVDNGVENDTTTDEDTEVTED
jgi:peptidoglycan hydrolase-like protein with peptidoglycan-binding domain